MRGFNAPKLSSKPSLCGEIQGSTETKFDIQEYSGHVCCEEYTKRLNSAHIFPEWPLKAFHYDFLPKTNVGYDNICSSFNHTKQHI